MTTSLSSKRTAEIAAAREADTLIAAKWDIYWEHNNKAVATRKNIKVAKSLAANYRGERLEAAQARIERMTEQLNSELLLIEQAREAAQELDADLYTGWSRFFLVQHIHNSQYCSSFRATTRVAWLPKVSGLTEKEAVEVYGETLCTKCFPDAPTALTVKAVAEDVCTADRDYSAPSRTGYYSGNWATCTEGHRAGVTSLGNIRKHKK